MKIEANTYRELIEQVGQACESWAGYPFQPQIEITTSSLNEISHALQRFGIKIIDRKSYDGPASFWFPSLRNIESRLLHNFPWLFRYHILSAQLTMDALKEIYGLYVLKQVSTKKNEKCKIDHVWLDGEHLNSESK